MSHQPAFQTLFPVTEKGIVLRIYHPRPWKNAYVFIKNGVVTHASQELVFTLGWQHEKVVERAEQAGFSISRQMNVSKPRDTWLTARPAPVQASLPSAPTLPPGVRPYSDPAGVRKEIKHLIDTHVLNRDALGRFISKNPTKSKMIL